MTLTALHQQIGAIQRTATGLTRTLELNDRVADTCGHPEQGMAAGIAQVLRRRLQGLFTRLHHLEARLPTPELLSERAYNRMISLGFEVDAAEAERLATYRAAAKPERKPYTKPYTKRTAKRTAKRTGPGSRVLARARAMHHAA